MDGGDCTLSGGRGLNLFCWILCDAKRACGAGAWRFLYNRRFDVVAKFFSGEKNGGGFDASLWDEEFGFGDADGSGCRRDHDEL
jgi:hypothetical protein